MDRTRPITGTVRYLARALLWALTLLALAGCSDQVTGPEPLADQQALSDIARHRHYATAVFLEGHAEVDGERVHVFAERTVSKFGGGDRIHLFTLPAAELELDTDLDAFSGPDDLRFDHRFYYDHDGGAFVLYRGDSRSRMDILETVPAEFDEEFTLAGETCREARDRARESPDSVADVDYAAAVCLWSGDVEIAREFAAGLVELSAKVFGGEQGYALHKAHTHLGRIALLEGERSAAKVHLQRSVQVTPSATMRTFGPNMALARDLLQAGERQAVLDYLEACGRFWSDDQLSTWTVQVRNGQTPDFSANLNY